MKPGLLILISSLILFASCRKSGDNIKPSARIPDIYIAGDDNYNAVYWKNGVEMPLSTVFSGDTLVQTWANAVTISNNNDIYIVGEAYSNGVYTPLIWKNGVIVDTLQGLNGLSTEYYHASPMDLSIVSSGNDIYIGGYEDSGKSSSDDIAILWKNGTPIAGGQNTLEFAKLILSNGNIYAPGAVISNINGSPIITPTVLSPAGSYANDISISGSDIYLAGSNSEGNNHGTPCYWKNGVSNILPLTIFTGLSDARSICVSDSGIYVTADDDVIWKNSIPSYFVSYGTNYYYSGIVAVNKDVYAIGEITVSTGPYSSTKTATVWKNGIPATLGGPYSDANDIYVH